MPLPPENINADISPREFEMLVKDYLEEIGKDLKEFSITHDKNIRSYDGEYQIDVYAEFEVLSSSFKILIECKRHKSRIKREVVQLLFDKIRTTGSHKGMIFSTGGFQEGAILFAKEHGIALIRVIEGRYTYFTKSYNAQNFDPPPWADIPKFVGEFRDDKSINYLQKGYLNSLKEFLFSEIFN